MDTVAEHCKLPVNGLVVNSFTLSANASFVAARLDSLGVVEGNESPALRAHYSVI
jgi:hypothetical protein